MGRQRTRTTVDDLVRRATGGRKLNRHKLFRPSLAYYLVKDPFWIWCHYHAPKNEAVDESTRYDELRMRQGVEYEQAWVEANYPDAVRIEPDFGHLALRNTLQAMLQGAPAIYQPQLWDLEKETYGKGDLLVRDDGHPSDLGPFHYRLIEIKKSNSLQEYHVLQAAFYNQILGMLQGHTGAEFDVVLQESSATIAYLDTEANLEQMRSLWLSLRVGETIPEPRRPPDSTNSPWRVYGNKQILEQKSLLLLAGIQKKERDKLRAAGIQSLHQLWDRHSEDLCDILGDHYGPIAYFVGQAYKTGEPLLKPGCQLEVPRAKRLIYFDFETSNAVHPTEPPHTYLIGCYDGNRDQYVKFLARGAEDEARIFEDFLDYAGDLNDTKFYHWTDFEIRQMRAVIHRWPMLAGRLERLIACCVDLKDAIQSAVFLPVPSFSIKCVAPALGFHWRQLDIGAYQSMVCYWDFLDGVDPSAIKKAILYNEDDCLAMWHVDIALQKRLGRSSS